jgi:SnoaL-like domain
VRTAPEGLDRLLALEDIRLLRAKYCRYIDSHKFDRLIEVLSEDFVLDMSPVNKVLGGHAEPIIGRDKVIEYMNARYRTLSKLLHIATIPIIEFSDTDNAIGFWRQETIVNQWDAGVPAAIAYATAMDSYRRVGGEWLISSVRLEIDIVI